MGRERQDHEVIRQVRAARESVKRGGSAAVPPMAGPAARLPVKLSGKLTTPLPERFTELIGAPPIAGAETVRPRQQNRPEACARPGGAREQGGPVEESESLPPAPEEVADLLRQTSAAERPDMIARLYRAFEAQVEQVEARLKELLQDEGAETATGEPKAGASIAEIDRTVKTLASLARTLTLLLDLKKTADGERQKEERLEGKADDSMPDADALRAQLAQRLGGLCPG